MKFLSIIILFLFSLLVSAEEQTQKPRTCRMLFLERPREAPSEAWFFDGKTSRKVSFSSTNFSDIIELPPGDLTIGLTGNAVANPDGFPTGAPFVRIPKTATDIYLLLISDPSNKLFPVRMQLLDIGNNKIKEGQTLWINLTNHRIAAKLGTEKLLIPPMKSAISPPPMGKSDYYKAQFAYEIDQKSGYFPLMKKTWWHDANSKSLGFIVTSNSGTPRIFTLRDHRAPADDNTEQIDKRNVEEE